MGDFPGRALEVVREMRVKKCLNDVYNAAMLSALLTKMRFGFIDNQGYMIGKGICSIGEKRSVNGRNLEQTGAGEEQTTKETTKNGEKTGTETKQRTSGLDGYAGLCR